MLVDELRAVLPAVDPDNGDQLQVVGRGQVENALREMVDRMGHAPKLVNHDALGRVVKSWAEDLTPYLDDWLGGDAAALVRRDRGQVRQVFCVRRDSPAEVFTTMLIGAMTGSLIFRRALYDVGIRRWVGIVHRSNQDHLDLLISRGQRIEEFGDALRVRTVLDMSVRP
jgi:hypothetical protein